MSKEEINKEDFQELIEKYLDGKSTLEELKLLVNYYESYQQEYTWVEELGSEEATRNRVLINIHKELQNEEENSVKGISFYQKTLFKYGVAASLILFIAFNFFFKDNQLLVDPINKSVIVNNDIKIGTDKAILTLEDGTGVILEKGENYIADNLSSNGEALIYNTAREKKTEIAYNYLTIPRGGQYQVKLSDGTIVWLNSESQIKYPVSFPKGEARQVELLYGEAYFDVSPSTNHNGAKFKILTGIQEVEVLGTEFNIKAYKDEKTIYTTLVEGKVAIKNGELNNILSPNQQSILNTKNNDLVIAKVDTFSEIAWKRGVFSFKNKSLKDIMKVLSRWYDVDVVFIDKTLEDVQFKGVLSKNQNIEEILILIKNTNFINAYEINNNTIILKN
ncbi:FecR family protein [Flavivirga rizhaonensis]|uniref:FecR family protein n=1 Tax=Flavivirga rizhaonensis TaxID=2559571 RepID=A0A4S1DRM7_9FLAO|nr:FecR family protein [Flavivirga rizhaonensis]TGV00561.1 FecR family protein [Flavivirga rizhaonensis]